MRFSRQITFSAAMDPISAQPALSAAPGISRISGPGPGQADARHAGKKPLARRTR